MKPPDGFRWLEKGETLAQGDRRKIDQGFGPVFADIRSKSIGNQVVSGQFIRKLDPKPITK